MLPAVTATFSAAAGTLRIVGDELDNTVVVSRTAAGVILVNNGAVVIQGDPGATVTNTHSIMITGAGGNDSLSVDETNGAMPGASIFGGAGNDVLIGGSKGDFIDGGTGNDKVFLGAGDDTFQWNPGDGSDVVEGQGGRDALVFNGSDEAEKFDITDSGNGLPFHRVRLSRDVGNVTMDLSGIEDIDLNANGGADTITVNDQTATDILDVNLDLGGAGFGDGQADAVIINGTNGDDFSQITSFGALIGANASFFPFVNITGAEGANDTLTVNALGGDDTVDASNLAAGVIKLTVIGGVGNDTLIGSPGGDRFVWNPGDGNDMIDGQAGLDQLTFNGSDAADNFVIARNGGHVLLTSDAGNVAMDLNAVEGIELNARAGADTIILNPLTGTGLFIVEVDLSGPAGGGDGQADSVILNGTNGDDAIRLGASGNTVLVDGLSPAVDITGSDGVTDNLTVNALGGNDTVDSTGLPSGLIGLTVNLGDGQAAPQVSSVAINDGLAQRSRVTSLTVTFSTQVTFTSTPAAAFTLTSNSNGAPVGFTATASVAGDVTVVTLSGFSGDAAQFGSLADGSYTLTTLANQVNAGGIALDGNADGTGGDNFTFGDAQGLYRLFGDINGDRVVNGLDFGLFRNAFGTQVGDAGYLSFLDFDGDGFINGFDLGQFRTRFGTMLP
jgi:hypothetical protein